MRSSCQTRGLFVWATAAKEQLLGCAGWFWFGASLDGRKGREVRSNPFSGRRSRSSSECRPAGRVHPSGGGDAEAADKAPCPVVGMEPVCRYFAMQRASKMGINVGLHGSHGLPSAVPGGVAAKVPWDWTEHPRGAAVVDLHWLRRLRRPGAW